MSRFRWVKNRASRGTFGNYGNRLQSEVRDRTGVARIQGAGAPSLRRSNPRSWHFSQSAHARRWRFAVGKVPLLGLGRWDEGSPAPCAGTPALVGATKGPEPVETAIGPESAEWAG